jgi:hypothetical protein
MDGPLIAGYILAAIFRCLGAIVLAYVTAYFLFTVKRHFFSLSPANGAPIGFLDTPTGAAIVGPLLGIRKGGIQNFVRGIVSLFQPPITLTFFVAAASYSGLVPMTNVLVRQHPLGATYEERAVGVKITLAPYNQPAGAKSRQRLINVTDLAGRPWTCDESSAPVLILQSETLIFRDPQAPFLRSVSVNVLELDEANENPTFTSFSIRPSFYIRIQMIRDAIRH